MSTIKVNSIKNTSTDDGGIAIDNSGHVQIDGQQLPTTGALSHRNILANGAMNIWQRGTSQTTSGQYGADRFWMANATSAARNTSAPAGFVYSTKLTYGSSDMAFGQPIELCATGKQDGALASGNTVTLSYYAKVDSDTEAIGTTINFRDSKFSSTNQVAFTSSNSSATWTTTWTRYEHQFTVPTVAGTNVLAALEIDGISKTAYITGVQLEVGEKATPFEHRSFGDELQRCERYFTRMPLGDNDIQFNFARFSASSGAAYYPVHLPTTMRAAPTFTLQGTMQSGSGYTGAVQLSNNGSSNDSTVHVALLRTSSGSFSASSITFAVGDSSDCAWDFSSEL